MNTRTLRRAAAYLPAAVLVAAGTLTSAAGWWLAGLALAGVSGILLAHTQLPARTTTPDPAGGGFRATDSLALHHLYSAALSRELHRQAGLGLDPATPEGTDCLAAAVLTVRDLDLETARDAQRDLVRRLGTARSDQERAARQARHLVGMWASTTEGPDAPGLRRAAEELRSITRTSA